MLMDDIAAAHTLVEIQQQPLYHKYGILSTRQLQAQLLKVCVCVNHFGMLELFNLQPQAFDAIPFPHLKCLLVNNIYHTFVPGSRSHRRVKR